MTSDERTYADFGRRIGSGLLSFPVTHFTPAYEFDEPAYRAHIRRLGGHPVAGLFAAGGTGEFFSLTLAEVERVVRAAVEESNGVPIVAPVGYGTATALEFVRAAERAGADGLLMFPPYLTEADQAGLQRHVETVCGATTLPVILYNRANGRFLDTTIARLVESCPNLVGLKDGVGDIEQMSRICARIGDRLTHIGGLPTCEMFAVPYLALGVTTYSSAIFNFLPEMALDFYRAVRAGSSEVVNGYLRDFFLPYCDLRNRKPGYAVSIIKAGLRATGNPAGPVRSPLVDLGDDETRRLAELIASVSAPR